MCAAADCDRPVLARGLCSSHYAKQREAHAEPCAVDGCSTPARARGLCNAHYKLRARTGSTNHQVRPTVDERFWSRVDKTETCWLWTGANNSVGYGQISWDGRVWLTHRFAYEFFVGPIPEGLTLDHLCRVPLCCNPAHLEPVTLAENIRRAASAITSCPRGHEYTPENLINTSSGHRRCKTCHREDQLARYQQQKVSV